MVKWANEKVKQGGKSSTMRSFKDPSLSNAVFFLDLLNAVKPGYVDYGLVEKGDDYESKRQNGAFFDSAVYECMGTVMGSPIYRGL
jgi:plastin-1